MSTKNVVHVVGTGTIGEPLIGLLTEYKKELGIDEVTFHKNSVSERPKVKALLRRGAKLAVDPDKVEGFKALGIEPAMLHDQALNEATVVIDCSPKGMDMKEKLYTHYEHNTKGFIAQGSEFGFGTMYARGINDDVLKASGQYVQVVSCNTHNLSCIIQVAS